MFVKICGLSTEHDISAAIGAGADAVGFVFAESVRRVDPVHAAKITAGVPAGVKRVAVMLHPTNDEWQEVLAEFAPDVLQTDAGDFENLDVPESVDCWPVFREGNRVTDTLKVGLKVSVTSFLYEGAQSGQGETVDWSNAAELAKNGNMILAGGLSAENVGRAIQIVRPYGVDVSSGVESAPGEKDSQKIRDFIIAAKAAGNNS
jgi:phosphoribosylanthranilate isomerase